VPSDHCLRLIGANILNIVLLLPPAPAALVLDGRAFATLSARSAAAFLRIAVAGPPGGLGEDGRAVVEPVDGEFTGDEGRGEDCIVVLARSQRLKYPMVAGCRRVGASRAGVLRGWTGLMVKADGWVEITYHVGENMAVDLIKVSDLVFAR
jgi:hypothetical protein